MRSTSISDDPDDDVCICDHARDIHRPKCDGKYAHEGWQLNSDRDCNCQKFVLDHVYKEPEAETCECCGQYD